jgi:SAM-dependent methyltransferase
VPDPHKPIEGVDPYTPNVARMYDYLLGGKDNYAADRDAVEKIVAIMPHAPRWVRDNRRFLGRAVRFLSEAGIRQFVDFGTGLPTGDNVHEVAERVAPGCRVVYVDVDPVVVSHGRALLSEDERTTVIRADLRHPEDVFADREIRGLIDFDRPVAVLLVAVLQFIADDREASQVIRRLGEALAPGSHLVISHITADETPPEVASEGRHIYAGTSIGSITPRTYERVLALLDGWELIEPGLVDAARWRIDGLVRVPVGFLAAVARKPA